MVWNCGRLQLHHPAAWASRSCRCTLEFLCGFAPRTEAHSVCCREVGESCRPARWTEAGYPRVRCALLSVVLRFRGSCQFHSRYVWLQLPSCLSCVFAHHFGCACSQLPSPCLSDRTIFVAVLRATSDPYPSPPCTPPISSQLATWTVGIFPRAHQSSLLSRLQSLYSTDAC